MFRRLTQRTWAPGGGASIQTVVLIKVAAAVAVLLGGSALAVASLSHRQAAVESASTADPDGSLTTEDLESLDEDLELAGDSVDGSDLGFLSFLGPKPTAKSTSDKVAATKSSLTRRVKAPTLAVQAPAPSGGEGSNPAPNPDPDPEPTDDPDPDPSPSPTDDPDPSPSPSPSDGGNNDPDLSAEQVFEAANQAQKEADDRKAEADQAGEDAGEDAGEAGEEANQRKQAAEEQAEETRKSAEQGAAGAIDTVTSTAFGLKESASNTARNTEKFITDTIGGEQPNPDDIIGGIDIDALLEEFWGYIEMLKGMVRDLLGIDADNPPSTDDAVEDALEAAGAAAGAVGSAATDALVTATAVAGEGIGIVTSTATSLEDQANGAIGTATGLVTGTVIPAANGAIDLVTSTATGAAGEAVRTVQEKVGETTLPPTLVTSMPVNVRTPDGSQIAVIAGHEYTVKSFGKYFFAQGKAAQADARCHNTIGMAGGSGVWGDMRFPGLPTDDPLLEILIGGQRVEWTAVEGGTCSNSNSYTYTFTASETGNLSVTVADDSYGDNVPDTNPLRIEVWDNNPGRALGSTSANPIGLLLTMLLSMGIVAHTVNIRRSKRAESTN